MLNSATLPCTSLGSLPHENLHIGLTSYYLLAKGDLLHLSLAAVYAVWHLSAYCEHVRAPPLRTTCTMTPRCTMQRQSLHSCLSSSGHQVQKREVSSAYRLGASGAGEGVRACSKWVKNT